ncbi:MAG: hypothetical protein HY822_23265 [Acidobacteria bacterium]|nr:hypothetical protein [Acidobacteriota bacterium]
MRSHTIAALLGVAALLTAGIPAQAKEEASRAQADRLISAIDAYYGPSAAESKVYVGSEFCLACHTGMAGWKNSLHATGLKMVPNDKNSMKVRGGIVFDYNKNGIDDFKDGLDFNKISSAFDKFKPNAPVLKYDAQKGYIVQIGEVDLPVVFAHGGSGPYKQRVVVRIPVVDRLEGLSAGVYEAPIQFNEPTKEYVLYNPQYWYTADNKPIFTKASTAKEAAKSNPFHKQCAGCHTTALSVWQDANGEWLSSAPPAILTTADDNHYLDLNFDGVPEQYNTGCERCHGPGGQHILSRGDPKKIINPGKLSARQANELCGGCHSRGASKPGELHEYPFDETANRDYGDAIGEPLFDKYSVNKAGVYPDGVTSRQHHQQLNDFMRSAKWEFASHKVTCFECHDVHADTKAQIRQAVTVERSGRKFNVPVKVEDNSLCLSCHAGYGPFDKLAPDMLLDIAKNRPVIAAVVESHSHHSYEPERALGLGRCTECHMAKTAVSGAPYDISGHDFAVIPPQKVLDTAAKGGMPYSCAVRCHRPLAPVFGLPADASLTTWNEDSDLQLARFLARYYGPNGIWWKKP